MAYQSNLLGDIVRRQNQRRALTGLPSTYQEQRGYFDAALDYDAKKQREAGLLQQRTNEFNREMALREQAQNDASRAATVGGVGQLAQLPMAYSSAKNLGWIGGAKTAPAASPNLMGTAPAAATTAQGAIAPTAAAGLTAQGSAAYTGATGTAAYGAAEGAGAAGVLGAEGSGAGLLGAGATAIGAGGAGYMAGDLLSNAIGANRPWSRTIKGAATGAAIGSVVPVIGTAVGGLIGGAIGAISSLF